MPLPNDEDIPHCLGGRFEVSHVFEMDGDSEEIMSDLSFLIHGSSDLRDNIMSPDIAILHQGES